METGFRADIGRAGGRKGPAPHDEGGLLQHPRDHRGGEDGGRLGRQQHKKVPRLVPPQALFLIYFAMVFVILFPQSEFISCHFSWSSIQLMLLDLTHLCRGEGAKNKNPQTSFNLIYWFNL